MLNTGGLREKSNRSVGQNEHFLNINKNVLVDFVRN